MHHPKLNSKLPFPIRLNKIGLLQSRLVLHAKGSKEYHLMIFQDLK